MYKAITISRELGSGGREAGFRLSKELGIPVYDKEIISKASEDSDIAEAAFHTYDEMLLEQQEKTDAYTAINPFSSVYEIPVSDQLFYLQSQAIQKLVKKGPCILIGRCSDVIVEDSLKIFLCSSMKKRMERLQKLEPETAARTLETRIREIDRKRRDYYQYYSGNEWGNPRNYELCLNSGRLGIERCVELIAECWKKENDTNK